MCVILEPHAVLTLSLSPISPHPDTGMTCLLMLSFMLMLAGDVFVVVVVVVLFCFLQCSGSLMFGLEKNKTSHS